MKEVVVRIDNSWVSFITGNFGILLCFIIVFITLNDVNGTIL